MQRTPSGFKTELTIRFVEESASDPIALVTQTIIDTLGPLYYDE